MIERSAGAILLVRTSKTQDEIVSAMADRGVRVSRVAVSQWQNGQTKPVAAKRRLLREIFGIPEKSWDESPVAKSKGARVAGPKAPAPALHHEVPRGVLAKAAALEDDVHALMAEVRDDEEATPLERAKVLASCATTLNLLARLTGQFDLGARLFTLPIWKRIERALEVGLDGHPKAAASVAREMRRVEEEHLRGTFDRT